MASSSLPSEGVLMICVAYTAFKLNAQHSVAHRLLEGLRAYSPPTEADIVRLEAEERQRERGAAVVAKDPASRLERLALRRLPPLKEGVLLFQPFFETFDACIRGSLVAVAVGAMSALYQCVAPSTQTSLWPAMLVLLAAASAAACNANLLWCLGVRLTNVRVAMGAGLASFVLSFPASHIPTRYLDCDVQASFAALHSGLKALAAAAEGKALPVGITADGKHWMENPAPVLGLSPVAFAAVCHLALSVAAAAIAAAVPLAAFVFGQTAAEQLREGGTARQKWRLRVALWLDVLLPWALLLLWIPQLVLPPAAARDKPQDAAAALALLRAVRAVAVGCALILRLSLLRAHLQAFLDTVPARIIASELAKSPLQPSSVRAQFTARVAYLPVAGATYVALPLLASAALLLSLRGSGVSVALCNAARSVARLPSCRQAAAAAANGGAQEGAGALGTAAELLRAMMDDGTAVEARNFLRHFDAAAFFPAGPASGVASFLLWWALLWWACAHTAAFLFWRANPLPSTVPPLPERHQLDGGGGGGGGRQESRKKKA